MKKLFEVLFLLFVLTMILIYKDNIKSYILDNYFHKKDIYISIANEYHVEYKFDYIEQTDDFIANNAQEVLNIFYTYLNNGDKEFYFYCDYDECQQDISKFNSENILANLNNFVDPFNTYKKLYIIPNSWGKIKVKVDKTYTQEEISEINSKMYQIIKKTINTNMTNKEKIKAFHDYIINNTRYDVQYLEAKIEDINNPSHKANGPLLYSKALCGGYSQVMSVFLNMLKIPNYRISSDTHIWNLVYLNGSWQHLDLTWDDPVTSNKSDILLNDYFLISTQKLESLNTGFHTFDKNVYKEAN